MYSYELNSSMTAPDPADLDFTENDVSVDARAQLAIDSMQLTHTVYVKFPTIDLVKPGENKIVRLIGPYNASNRFPHEDLVDDPSVVNVASRLNRQESSMFVQDQISVRSQTFTDHGTAPRLAPMQPGTDDLTRLLHDVQSFQKTVGKTTLKIVTYMPADDPERWNGMTVRVERKSRARSASGEATTSMSFYDFLLTRLEEEVHTSPVTKLMIQTIYRMNTRAVRHVKYWLRVVHASERAGDSFYLPSRKVRLIDLLDPLMDSVSRADLSTAEVNECHICLGDFDSASHRPVRVRPCGHIFGYECFRKWFLQENVEDGRLKIPQCPNRCNILDETTVQRRERNGTFYNLPNFTEYENFETSLADLDAAPHVRRVTNKEIVVQRQVMERALTHLTNGALTEGASSTPLHLQAGRFPETQLAVSTIRRSLRASDGCRLVFHNLFDYLHVSIADELLAKCKASPYPQFLDYDDRMAMTVHEWANHPVAPVRLGFYEYVDRLIHRMVMFQELRGCECQAGFHQHGARLFWNRDDYPRVEADRRKSEKLRQEINDLMADRGN